MFSDQIDGYSGYAGLQKRFRKQCKDFRRIGGFSAKMIGYGNIIFCMVK